MHQSMQNRGLLFTFSSSIFILTSHLQKKAYITQSINRHLTETSFLLSVNVAGKKERAPMVFVSKEKNKYQEAV